MNYIYTPDFAWIGSAGVNSDSGLSREHTWCHNWMPTNPADSPERNEYSDQHHLFPVNQNHANVIRNDHPLGIVATLDPSNGTFLSAKFGKNANGETVYEPRDQHKGDAARAILYMALRYDGIDGYRWTFDTLRARMVWKAKEAPEDLQVLLDWHRQDPPGRWEVERNDYIQSIQGNRNPFVDHPEYVNYIDFNDLSKLSPSYSAEPTNQPTALNVASSGTTLNITWTVAAAGSQTPSGYLLEAYNGSDYFIPMDGEAYTNDADLSDSKATVFVGGGATSYSFTGLAGGTYYVRIYSYNGSGTSINYKIDGTIQSGTATIAGTLADEPTNYPSGFDTPTITSSSITVAWTDPSGAVLPSGYLLMANTTNIFADPSDGATYGDDTNLADGTAQVNVAYGAQSYTFTGLPSSTQYSFRLYPYNGSGTSRNYKTEIFPGTLTTIYATSASGGGTGPSVVVNEYFNGTTGVSEWIELLVLQDNLDMRGYKIQDYTSAGNLNTNPLTFASTTFWSSVRHGSLIVIYTSGTPQPTADNDFSDKKVVLSATDGTYFSGASFQIAGSDDAVQILNAGSTHVHALSHGSLPGLISLIPQPRANASGSSSSGNVVRFINAGSAADFSDNAKTQHSATATPGLPNDQTESNYITNSLPVELTSFTATVNENEVTVSWHTATEVNNYGFEVERAIMNYELGARFGIKAYPPRGCCSRESCYIRPF
jgi:endonuclease I